MKEIIDFTNMPRQNKTYAGANGSKISILFNNERYMLKFPGAAKRNANISYANGCISEYLGSQIFTLVGIPTQETILGVFSDRGRIKTVVACKDFTDSRHIIQDFGSLKNTIIETSSNGYGTELSEILQTIETQSAMDAKIISERFWDMFIIDALIGNWDRHNGNWGFLYDLETDRVSLAPVYDCGSCLFPQADEEMMRSALENSSEMDSRVFDRPLSGIKENGQKINYFRFISSLKDPSCCEAVKRIVPSIDMDRIHDLIYETPMLSEVQRLFYYSVLKERKERILDYSLQKILKRELKQRKPR